MTKTAFSKELCLRLIDQYGRMPSAAVVCRDFNLRANDVSTISQETARRWIRALSLPEIDKLQILIQWLKLDLAFLDISPKPDIAPTLSADQGTSEALRRRDPESSHLESFETYLVGVFRQTDERGRHCLISLAKSLQERPQLSDLEPHLRNAGNKSLTVVPTSN